MPQKHSFNPVFLTTRVTTLTVITETNFLLGDFEVLFKVRIYVLHQEYFYYKSSDIAI